MPPIQIHKDAPIKPTTGALPDGITPKTADSNPQQPPPPTRTTPYSQPATTTASAYTNDNPPPPQPGARPVPPNAGAPAPTSSYSTNNPPAPQPGAGPGYTAHHMTTETRLSAPPAQFNIPPPTDSQLAGRSTTASTTPSQPGPTTLNMGPAASPYEAGGAVPTRTSLEHPPGYVQAPDNHPSNPLPGAGAGEQASTGSGSGGVGDAAWNMLSRAGEALKKGEEAAWRAVRK